MSRFSEKHTKFIIEVVRLIVHPITGIGKKMIPIPKTYQDWRACLMGSETYGWVDLGISDKMADVFKEVKVGEVIPRLSQYMDIYKNSYSTQIISKLLGLTDKENIEKRAVLNYYSFSRLMQIITNSTTKEYTLKFNEDIKKVFKGIDPRTFWLNLFVSERVAWYLTANQIGEVIVNEGSDDKFKHVVKKQKRVKWKNTNETKNMTDDNDESMDIEGEINTDNPFRLIMNNTTIFNMIKYACVLKGKTKNNINVYDYLCGDKNNEEEFLKLFGKLGI